MKITNILILTISVGLLTSCGGNNNKAENKQAIDTNIVDSSFAKTNIVDSVSLENDKTLSSSKLEETPAPSFGCQSTPIDVSNTKSHNLKEVIVHSPKEFFKSVYNNNTKIIIDFDDTIRENLSLEFVKNLTIEGGREHKTVFATKPNTLASIDIIDCNNITLRNLEIGQKVMPKKGSGASIYFDNTKNVTIDRCKIYNGDYGISFTGDDICNVYNTEFCNILQHGVFIKRPKNISFVNCDFHDCGNPINLVNVINPVSFEKCCIVCNSSNSGFSIKEKSTFTDCLIQTSTPFKDESKGKAVFNNCKIEEIEGL
ncbi:MAG: right-handed parallel beta-helix repeat-containing protein [Bacteroidales bacterium]|nr:right-handed parallel beta-helix repeat-containing protein [Bacteroidales bacterium]